MKIWENVFSFSGNYYDLVALTLILVANQYVKKNTPTISDLTKNDFF